MIKVYIAYEGHYIQESEYGFFDVLGVYSSKNEAIDRIQESIGSLEGIEVEEKGSTTFWIERGMEIVTVGKLEEHILIS